GTGSQTLIPKSPTFCVPVERHSTRNAVSASIPRMFGHSFVLRLPRRSLLAKAGHSCFLICGLLLAASAFAQKRNITEKDICDFVWIGDHQISPDGSRVAFVRVTTNERKEGYNTSIWLVETTGNQAPHQLTKGEHDSTPRWSPDGKFLL